jgi:hypothetical protein
MDPPNVNKNMSELPNVNVNMNMSGLPDTKKSPPPAATRLQCSMAIVLPRWPRPQTANRPNPKPTQKRPGYGRLVFNRTWDKADIDMISHNLAHQDAPTPTSTSTSQGTRRTPTAPPIALVLAYVFNSVSACSHVPLCTPTLLLVYCMYTPRTKICKQIKY